MNVFTLGGGERHGSTAPRVGRGRGDGRSRARGFIPAGGLRGALRGFRRGSRGGVAIESSFALGILVVALAGLMQIVSAIYATDVMGRAARAAAHALALDAAADSCAAIRRELGLDPAFDCDAEWTVAVSSGIGPAALPAPLHAPPGAGAGELVLVRVALPPGQPPGSLSADARIAIGVARRELNRGPP